MCELEEKIAEAVEWIKESNYTVAFTGAGISVESGIPPFRGENGLWNKYDPCLLDINYFYRHPLESWRMNREIFYEVFASARPNPAHRILALMEDRGLLQTIITQNIDGLHQQAGSSNILHFHGTSQYLNCIECGEQYEYRAELLDDLPPRCPECNGILKPDFTFFGEPIPEQAVSRSFQEAEQAELLIIIGTTGEVQPAALIPYRSSEAGARIIEINISASNFTGEITDLFLQGPAVKIMQSLKGWF